MKKKKIEAEIPPWATVDFTQYQNGGAEIRWIQRPTKPPEVKNVGGGNYIDLRTGKYGKYRPAEERSMSKDSLRKTFRRLRGLINNNFSGGKNELAMTLTYRENMTDPERLYTDFKAFWKRLDRKYGHLEYLSVIEPQARGAWHCHVLVKCPDKGTSLFIPAEELAKLWGNGFVKVRRLDEVSNLGAYLSAYLGDVEISPENEEYLKTITGSYEIKEIISEGKTKRYVKGARLHLYPPGMNIYRKSKGIAMPQPERVSYNRAKKMAGAGKAPAYRTATAITDGEKEIYNTIIHEFYERGNHMNITINGDVNINFDGEALQNISENTEFCRGMLENIADEISTNLAEKLAKSGEN